MNMLILLIGLFTISLASTVDLKNSDNATTCEITNRCDPIELDHLSGSQSGKTLWQLATLQKITNRTSNVTTAIVGSKNDLQLESTALHSALEGGKGVGHNESHEHGKRCATIWYSTHTSFHIYYQSFKIVFKSPHSNDDTPLSIWHTKAAEFAIRFILIWIHALSSHLPNGGTMPNCTIDHVYGFIIVFEVFVWICIRITFECKSVHIMYGHNVTSM